MATFEGDPIEVQGGPIEVKVKRPLLVPIVGVRFILCNLEGGPKEVKASATPLSSHHRWTHALVDSNDDDDSDTYSKDGDSGMQDNHILQQPSTSQQEETNDNAFLHSFSLDPSSSRDGDSGLQDPRILQQPSTSQQEETDDNAFLHSFSLDPPGSSGRVSGQYTRILQQPSTRKQEKTNSYAFLRSRILHTPAYNVRGLQLLLPHLLKVKPRMRAQLLGLLLNRAVMLLLIVQNAQHGPTPSEDHFHENVHNAQHGHTASQGNFHENVHNAQHGHTASDGNFHENKHKAQPGPTASQVTFLEDKATLGDCVNAGSLGIGGKKSQKRQLERLIWNASAMLETLSGEISLFSAAVCMYASALVGKKLRTDVIEAHVFNAFLAKDHRKAPGHAQNGAQGSEQDAKHQTQNGMQGSEQDAKHQTQNGMQGSEQNAKHQPQIGRQGSEQDAKHQLHNGTQDIMSYTSAQSGTQGIITTSPGSTSPTAKSIATAVGIDLDWNKNDPQYRSSLKKPYRSLRDLSRLVNGMYRMRHCFTQDAWPRVWFAIFKLLQVRDLGLDGRCHVQLTILSASLAAQERLHSMPQLPPEILELPRVLAQTTARLAAQIPPASLASITSSLVSLRFQDPDYYNMAAKHLMASVHSLGANHTSLVAWAFGRVAADFGGYHSKLLQVLCARMETDLVKWPTRSIAKAFHGLAIAHVVTPNLLRHLSDVLVLRMHSMSPLDVIATLSGFHTAIAAFHLSFTRKPPAWEFLVAVEKHRMPEYSVSELASVLQCMDDLKHRSVALFGPGGVYNRFGMYSSSGMYDSHTYGHSALTQAFKTFTSNLSEGDQHKRSSSSSRMSFFLDLSRRLKSSEGPLGPPAPNSTPSVRLASEVSMGPVVTTLQGEGPLVSSFTTSSRIFSGGSTRPLATPSGVIYEPEFRQTNTNVGFGPKNGALEREGCYSDEHHQSSAYVGIAHHAGPSLSTPQGSSSSYSPSSASSASSNTDSRCWDAVSTAPHQRRTTSNPHTHNSVPTPNANNSSTPPQNHNVHKSVPTHTPGVGTSMDMAHPCLSGSSGVRDSSASTGGVGASMDMARHHLAVHLAASSLPEASDSSLDPVDRTRALQAEASDSSLEPVDVSRALQGEDPRTTLVIHNIPNDLAYRDLQALMDEPCTGAYSIVYMR
eukprot:gene23110-30311_t